MLGYQRSEEHTSELQSHHDLGAALLFGYKDEHGAARAPGCVEGVDSGAARALGSKLMPY